MTAPTREQSILGWAIHCDLIDSRDIDEEFVKSILEKLKEFSDLAYDQGRKDEREACAQIVERNAAACDNNAMLRDVLMSNAAAIRKRGEDENIS